MKVHSVIINESLMSVNTVSLIPLPSELLFNSGMKTCDQIRRENLLLLISQAGGVNKLAEAYDCTEAAIKAWAKAYKDSKTGVPKEIGRVPARKLEEVTGKETGWMDHDHSDVKSLNLTNDEQTILEAFQYFGPEVKEIWLDTARKAVNKQRDAKNKAA